AEMAPAGWDEMAEWWDTHLGDEGDLWHRALIDPPLLRLAGDVSGLRVLDVACGNGYLSRRFARAGATVTGADATAAIIERACARERREPLGVVYHVLDAANLEPLADGSFDLVICNMALMDIENAVGAIQEVARVLRPRGRFVASLAHPCFDKMGTSGWAIEHIYPTTTIWRKMSRYREIATADLPWLRVADAAVYTRTYHRPLSWYVRTLREAGLLVAALEEPEPAEEFLAGDSQGPWIAEIPLHCVLEAWKVS
ncbi:MAG: class I SAM-dependent methyltransferase, partial [Ktedonobacterales bacterium]